MPSLICIIDAVRLPHVLVPVKEVGERHVADGADCIDLLLLLLLLLTLDSGLALVMVLLSRIVVLLGLQ